MTDEQHSAPAGDEAAPADSTGLSRRRLLQALGGTAGLASVGIVQDGLTGRGRAQSDGSDDWTQQQKFAPNDVDDDDRFGSGVSVSNDGMTAVVGAEGDEDDGDPTDPRAGSAYVFRRNGGQWTQQQKLAPDDGDEGDQFGEAVSVSGDGITALIGAPKDEDPNGDNAGSAYVFSRSNGQWSQQQKLLADDGTANDQFGFAVSVSCDGTTAVIGARLDDGPDGIFAGSAYVFSRSNGQWTQQQKLTPDDGDEQDRFGRAVSVSGDGTTAVVGAVRDEDPNGFDAGSAYVFTRSGGQWSQQQKLTPDDGDDRDDFGFAVSVSADGATAVIGAVADDDGPRVGSAYVFSRSNGQWTQQQKLLAGEEGPREADDLFGFAVSVSNDGMTAVVGAPFDEAPNGFTAGSAYVFTQTNGQWSPQQKLLADEVGGEDRFGWAVSVPGDGTTALIGASGRTEGPTGVDAGAAYAFTTPNTDAMSTPTATPSPSPTQSTGTPTPSPSSTQSTGTPTPSPSPTQSTGTAPPTRTETCPQTETVSTTATTDTTTASGPGFGVGTAVAAVGVIGYLLRRRRHLGSDD